MQNSLEYSNVNPQANVVRNLSEKDYSKKAFYNYPGSFKFERTFPETNVLFILSCSQQVAINCDTDFKINLYLI
ncbi:hypothetical protein DP923_14100 [Pontibacter arcticus]|uniref:Uncharacterized protein n=1 Tax=Pontibacter arcticus TaxID=2080288 RepID=A0A364RC18_9BACT|nr:hypothetical protein DP923_14100 [Pontibacter arcticus]